MKPSPLPRFSKPIVARWSRKHIAPGAEVVSDAFGPLRGVEVAGLAHVALVTGGGFRSMEVEALQWVNVILGNLKNSLLDTYHGMRRKHLAHYLAEFSYRFNRRFELKLLVGRLLRTAAKTPPFPLRLVTLAEVYWYNYKKVSAKTLTNPVL